MTADNPGMASIREAFDGLEWSVTITSRGNGTADVVTVLTGVDSDKKCRDDVLDVTTRGLDGSVTWNTTKNTYTPGYCR